MPMPQDVPVNHQSTPTSGFVDVLIVGQGICGSFLGWFLQKAGLSFIVLDDRQPNSASRAASGVINPVTGRRIVKTWMIDDLLPFAAQTYRQLGYELGVDLISQKNIVDFFPTPQMRNAFLQRYDLNKEYLQMPDDENSWHKWFHYDFGYGVINPCYTIELHTLLDRLREKWAANGQLRPEKMVIDELQPGENMIHYRDIKAGKIVFCDGIGSATNPWFKDLPFAPNKGEALIARIKDLPCSHLFKRGFSLVPLQDDFFWAGSSYEWNYEHDQPTEIFRNRTIELLNRWLKVPFHIEDHIASVRPATLERRPFAGFHPVHRNLGILNGMGSKGCALAPWFAKQLADHITENKTISPEAEVRRFSGILRRGG